jgi:hypothetical protein
VLYTGAKTDVPPLLVCCLLLLPQDLNNFQIPGVNEARDLYQADVVQMIIEAVEYCG